MKTDRIARKTTSNTYYSKFREKNDENILKSETKRKKAVDRKEAIEHKHKHTKTIENHAVKINNMLRAKLSISK